MDTFEGPLCVHIQAIGATSFIIARGKRNSKRTVLLGVIPCFEIGHSNLHVGRATFCFSMSGLRTQEFILLLDMGSLDSSNSKRLTGEFLCFALDWNRYL